MIRVRTAAAFCAATASVVVLSGCGGGVVDTADTAQQTPVHSAAPAPSEDAALAAFQAALERVPASEHPATRAVLEEIAAAGYDPAVTEATSDVDSLGAPVTNIEVAVRDRDRCLIGQLGDGPPTSIAAPILGTGRCLVGGAAPVG